MSIIYENIKKFFKNIDNHHISEYTAQCAYYTILSFIPLLILIVTLIQYTEISKESFIEIIQYIMPETMYNTTNQIVQEVYSKSVGTISISAIFVLWSAGRGLYALCKGLYSIYETKNEYNYLRIQIKSIISTILFVFIVVLALTISVFGNSILELVQLKWNIPSHIINVFNISKIGIYIILFFIILLMYRFIPGHKLSIIKQIPGAVIATVGWYVISFFFSIYINMFKGFSVMYGSLTTITLSMMWVYFCMYSILLGAEINMAIKSKIK